MGCCKSETEVQLVDGGFPRKKGCTDFPALLVFIAFIGGMGYVIYRCLDQGDPYKLLYGVDSWGNTCNRDNIPLENATYSGRDLQGYKNLFYYNFQAVNNPLLDTLQICVKACPNGTISSEAGLWDLLEDEDIQLCRYDLNRTRYFAIPTAERLPDDDMAAVCPSLDVASHSEVFFRCVPRSALQFGASIFSAAVDSAEAMADEYVPNQCEGRGMLESMASDLKATYRDIGVLIAISAGVAMVVMILLRFVAPIFIWVMVIACIVLSAGAAAYTWLMYLQFKGDLDAIPAEEQNEEEKNYVRNWFYAAIATSVVAGIILLIIIVMFKRIRLVVQLFREAGKAVGAIVELLILPIFTAVFHVAALGVLGFGYMFIFTAETPVVNNVTGLVKYEGDDILYYMKWYYLFGIFWIREFIQACEIMLIAGAVSIWYFSRDKPLCSCCRCGAPFWMSLRRLICQHLGTVAFGSFWVALVQFLRAVVMFIQTQLKGRSSKLAQYILKAMACCLWCLEKILKFFTKNAYIMSAIYGCNFCRGGMKAASTLLSNILRVGALNSIGTFTLFLGKLAVVAPVVILALYRFQERTDICFMYAPMVLVAVGAFVVADCWLGVYGYVVDTLFLCFCVDCDENDGVTKPYYMSKNLMKFVDNSSEAQRHAEKSQGTNNNNSDGCSGVEASRLPLPSSPGAGQNNATSIEW